MLAKSVFVCYSVIVSKGSLFESAKGWKESNCLLLPTFKTEEREYALDKINFNCPNNAYRKHE